MANANEKVLRSSEQKDGPAVTAASKLKEVADTKGICI